MTREAGLPINHGVAFVDSPPQALYHHQRLALPDQRILTAYTYVSPRGTMTVFDGKSFTTVLQNRGVLPEVPPALDGDGFQADMYHNYLYPLLQSVSTLSTTDGRLTLDKLLPLDNNYITSQAMYGALQLIPLLQEVSASSDPGLSAADKADALVLAERVFNVVKDRMSSWLSAADDGQLELLYYQPRNPKEDQAKGKPG